MKASASRRLLLVTAVLVAGAAALLAFGSTADSARRERQRGLQRALGGLGLGPALDLGDGAAAYDPRIGAPAHGGPTIVKPGSASR